MCSALGSLTHRVTIPQAPVPEGRIVRLPGAGTTYVTDTPGPGSDAPVLVLLHALATTGRLSWYPSIGALSERYRVITLDLRWHGRGVGSPIFALPDCADDVVALMDVLGIERAVMVGYSMGSVVAQRVWRQHPTRVSGLVLGATTARFRTSMPERGFHAGLAAAMYGVRGVSSSRVARRATRSAARTVLGDDEELDLHDWAIGEFRSTSPWAVGQALAALGRHSSRPWLRQIDVPTAVLVTTRDRVIPPRRQREVAERIPGAVQYDVPGGHAALVMQADLFVPVLLEACAMVIARVRDAEAAPH